jgi:hypothetical protein
MIQLITYIEINSIFVLKVGYLIHFCDAAFTNASNAGSGYPGLLLNSG